MISWARAVLGQTQTTDAPVDLEDETLAILTAKKIESLQTAERSGRSPSASYQWLPLGISIAVAIGAFVLLGQEVQRSGRLGEELFAAQRQVAQLLTNNRQLTQQMAGLQAQRNELDEKMLALEAQLTAAISEVERAKSHVMESQRLSKQFSEAEAYLKAQLSIERTERETAQQEATQLKQEKDELEQSVGHLRQRLALLERDYRRLTNEITAAKSAPRPDVPMIATTESPRPAADPLDALPQETRAKAAAGQQPFELAPIVVPSSGAGTRSLIRGQLIELNGAQHFIIIDKGSADGVREGMVFDIFRGRAAVGQATVIKLRSHMAACDIDSAMRANAVQIGDTVVQRGAP